MMTLLGIEITRRSILMSVTVGIIMAVAAWWIFDHAFVSFTTLGIYSLAGMISLLIFVVGEMFHSAEKNDKSDD